VHNAKRRFDQLALIVDHSAAQQRQRELIDEQLGVVRGDDGVARCHVSSQCERVLKSAASATIYGNAQFQQRLTLALTQKPNLLRGALGEANGMS
jgi:hypothetical protein